MIFDFLKKQKEFKQKKKLTQIMIMSLQISESQKILYIQALEILDKQWVDNLYLELTRFIENFELKELKEISKNNYSNIAWMRKKEAVEKQKDINSFSFLINNL